MPTEQEKQNEIESQIDGEEADESQGEGYGGDEGADGDGGLADEEQEETNQEGREELLDDDGDEGDETPPPAEDEFSIPDLDDEPAGDESEVIDPAEALAEAQRAAVLAKLEAKRTPPPADPVLARKEQLLKEHAEAAQAGNPSDIKQLLDALGFDESRHHAYEGTVAAFAQQLLRVAEVSIADQYERKEAERLKQSEAEKRAAAEKAIQDRFKQSLEALPESQRKAVTDRKAEQYLTKALGGEQVLTELKKRSRDPAALMLSLGKASSALSLERLAEAAGDAGDFVNLIRDLDDKIADAKRGKAAQPKQTFKADQRIPHTANAQASVESKKRAIEQLRTKIASTTDVVRRAELSSKLADLMS